MKIRPLSFRLRRSTVPCLVLYLIMAAGWGLSAPESDLLNLGRQAFYGGKMSEARELLVSYLRLNPHSTEARILLARTLAGLARPADAMVELKRVLDQDPKNEDALFYLGSLSAALTQDAYARLYRLAPDSPRIHQLLGESYQLRENYEEAKAEYQKALDLNPALPDVVLALADVERTMGRFQEAMAIYRRVLELTPADYQATYGIGVCYRFLEDDRQAEAYFRRSIELAPTYAAGRLALGQALVRSGAFEEAVLQLNEAIRLEPNLDQAYFQLGRALQSLGRGDEAQAAFEKARLLRLKNSPLR